MKVFVVAASDTEQDPARKLRWGDHWFKEGVSKAVVALGHEVTDNAVEADVLIHLHGIGVERLPDWTYNILWVHSHPDELKDTKRYDAVFAEGKAYAESIKAVWLPGASAFAPMQAERKYEAVFVGNSRNGSRPCVDAFLKGNPDPSGLAVWGEGWEKLHAGCWKGTYYPHEQLNALYASAGAVLGDSHPDMEKWGFVNPREYDIKAVAGEKVPTFLDVTRTMLEGVRWQTKLDLGCGAHKRAGYIGIDKVALPGVDIVRDVREPLPFRDGMVDYIVADNLMEHIGADFIRVMNDCHRMLRPGGRMLVVTPGTHTEAAFSDPTHVRFFTPETWTYFDGANERHKDYGASYGIKPWEVLEVRVRERFVEASLRRGA